MNGLLKKTPSLQIASPEALVEVYVVQARNLPRTDAAGQSNSYCVVEATSSQQMYKTHVVRKSLHPVWNESFQVKVSNSQQQMITVKIWSERSDGSQDDFVGVVVVPVTRIASGMDSKEEGWYEIRGEKNDVLVGPDGMSKIELSFVHKTAKQGLQPICGTVQKWAPEVEEWQHLFFVGDPYNQMLRYFSSPEAAQETSPVVEGEFNIRCCEVLAIEIESAEISRLPSMSGRSHFFKVQTHFGMVIACTTTVEERDVWIQALKDFGNPPGIRVLPPPPHLQTASNQPAPRKLPVMAEPHVKPQQAAHKTPERPGESPSTQSGGASGQPGGGVTNLEKKYDATRRALADHVSKCMQLQQKVDELEQALKRQGNERLNDLQNRNTELVQTLQQTQALLDQQKVQAENERALAQQLSRELEAIRAMQVNGVPPSKEFLEEKQQLHDTIRQMEDDAMELKEQNRALHQDKTKLIADNKELQARFEAVRQGLANHMREQREKANTAADDGEQVEQLKKKLEKMETRSRETAEGYAATLSQMEDEKRLLVEELAKYKDALSDAESSMTSLSNQVNSQGVDSHVGLLKQLEEAHRALADVKQKHLRAEQSRMVAESELEEVKRTSMYGGEVKQASAKDETIESLQRQVETLNRQLKESQYRNPLASVSPIAEPPSNTSLNLSAVGPHSLGYGGSGSLSARAHYPNTEGNRTSVKARDLLADITSTLTVRSTRLADVRDTNTSVRSSTVRSEIVQPSSAHTPNV